MTGTTIELVTFRVKSGIMPDQVRAAAQRVSIALAKMPGFCDRQLGLSPDGEWADIVVWQDLATAQRAAQTVPELAECQAFFSLIDDSTVRMNHLEAQAI